MSVLDLNSLPTVLERLNKGLPLAVPTETVYGLAARIDLPLAIRQIFAIKERPVNHPLIIHCSDIEMAKRYAHFTELDLTIGQTFWPGPLTLILRKKLSVIDEVTGGLPTVGVRIPNHPITLAIIRQLGIPLAAPSANRFGKTSPTTAEHVEYDFKKQIPVVNGGPCSVGIESTILDLTVDPPSIRRLGAIDQDSFSPWITHFGSSATPTAGTHKAHYAPSTALFISDNIVYDEKRLKGQGLSVETISFSNSSDYAHLLYAELRRLDQLGVDILIALRPQQDSLGLAVLDRLTRAAHGSQESN